MGGHRAGDRRALPSASSIRRGGATATMSTMINECPGSPTAGALAAVIAVAQRREPTDRLKAAEATRMIPGALPPLPDQPPSVPAGCEATVLTGPSRSASPQLDSALSGSASSQSRKPGPYGTS
jgi:hypothetical protein